MEAIVTGTRGSIRISARTCRQCTIVVPSGLECYVYLRRRPHHDSTSIHHERSVSLASRLFSWPLSSGRTSAEHGDGYVMNFQAAGDGKVAATGDFVMIGEEVNSVH